MDQEPDIVEWLRFVETSLGVSRDGDCTQGLITTVGDPSISGSAEAIIYWQLIGLLDRYSAFGMSRSDSTFLTVMVRNILC